MSGQAGQKQGAMKVEDLRVGLVVQTDWDSRGFYDRGGLIQ
jgi:hypothetical protein